MILMYINSDIIDNHPDNKEVYSKVNYMLYGRWLKCEFGRKREIVGTTQYQILTFASENILFETILN